MLNIREFRSKEWLIYKSLRMDALRDAPDAFGSTYEDSLKITDEQWKARLADVDGRFSFPAGAFWYDEPVGLAWGRIEPECPERADIYQMWASPDHRGRGVGRGLLDLVLAWAVKRKARDVFLGVTIGNAAATALYESAGFRVVGEPELLRPGSDKFIQNMRLTLDR